MREYFFKSLALVLFFFFLCQTSLSVFSYAEENCDSLPVRILLESKKTSFKFHSEESGWLIAPGQSSAEKLWLNDSSIHIELFPCTAVPRYFARTRESWGFERALMKANQLHTMVRQTDLDIFLVFQEGLTFALEAGPFAHLVDASFFCSLINAQELFFAPQELPPDSGFAMLFFNDQPFAIKSEIFSFLKNAPPIWSIEKKNHAFIKFNDRQYPYTMNIGYSPSHQLMLINELPMEEYLRSVVPAEMPHRWNTEALKAQAVASRTYAYSRLLQARKIQSLFDLTNDTFSQVYLGARFFPESDQAVRATRNQILVSNDQIIESVYHSTSGGHTENNENVWSGGPRNYLRGVPSLGEEASPHFTWYKYYPEKDFLHAINQFQISKSKKERLQSLTDSTIINRGSSPRVLSLLLFNENEFIELKGTDFQSIFSLKSTWFDLLIWRPDNINGWRKDYMASSSPSTTWVYIYGRGWGHGVGMSQHGASAQARRGARYNQILQHFYQGAELVSFSAYINSIPSSTLNHSPQNPPPSCQLSFSPASLSLETDSEWKLDLNISSPQSVQGISLDIIFDPQYLSISEEGVKEGAFLKTGDKTTLFLKKKEGSSIHVGLGREGKAGGVTGDGTLLEINGKSLARGNTVLKLENIRVFNSQMEEVPVHWENISFEIIETDRIPPKTLIIEYPPSYINHAFVTFKWTGADNETKTENLFYSYRLNQEEWSMFSRDTSYTFNLLQDGNYVFSVRARDDAGNIDPQPPTYTFFLHTSPPPLEFDPFPGQTFHLSILLKGKTGPDVTLLVNAEHCLVHPDGTFVYEAILNPGENLFRFIAIDLASNTRTKDIVVYRNAIESIRISLTIGSSQAIINGVIKSLDAAPFIEQARTYVPLRLIAEAFHSEVEWFSEEKKINIRMKHPLLDRNILLWVGSNNALVDDNNVWLDAPPVIKPPGRTFVPVRFVSENLGAEVTWHPQTQSVHILFPGPALLQALDIYQQKTR